MSDDKEAPAELPIHQPVFVNEIVSLLLPALSCQAKAYLDCTVGLGGHTEAILNAAPPETRVIAMDRDWDALSFSKRRLMAYSNRIAFFHGSFKEMMTISENANILEYAAILLDLGVSSLQLDCPERGFSFQQAGPLDMRMDQQLPLTAAQLVNTLREKELADLIYQYGEERCSRKIAAWIVQCREKEGEITKTDQLANLICRAVRGKSKWTKTHPATKTFQALRMVVNDELGQIEAGLDHATSLLAVGGRLAVISFHSLEDRSVKTRFKSLSRSPLIKKRFINLYKKPIVPTEEEVSQNPRSRSAKLRVLERVA
jgi:16S rRNA (cytosine1402-N4)-methyltransferase